MYVRDVLDELARILMLTGSLEDQRPWSETQLDASDVAVVHGV